MAVSQERISVYNLAGTFWWAFSYYSYDAAPLTNNSFLLDLKNTSDDAIPNYLNSLRFTQSHRLTDVRLALGYSAFAIAAACFLWDYKFGFESTKLYTGIAVAIYTILNGILTYWIFNVEKGTIYEGTAPSGEKIRISTSTPNKTVPEYHLKIDVVPKNGRKKERLVVIRSFTEWFDAAGHFVVAPFQTVLASSIPVVGKADPKRIAGPSKKEDVDAAPPPAYTAEMLDVLAGAGVSVVGSAAEAETSGADAVKKTAGKRRKA
ncbi:signal peptidase complex subunit SPC2 [Naviculisporaceae sp. PSN 640]